VTVFATVIMMLFVVAGARLEAASPVNGIQ
jgi:hypothetical protein